MRPALDPSGHRVPRTKPACLLHTWRPTGIDLSHLFFTYTNTNQAKHAPAILSQESVHTTLSITHHTRKRPSTGPRTTQVLNSRGGASSQPQTSSVALAPPLGWSMVCSLPPSFMHRALVDEALRHPRHHHSAALDLRRVAHCHRRQLGTTSAQRAGRLAVLPHRDRGGCRGAARRCLRRARSPFSRRQRHRPIVSLPLGKVWINPLLLIPKSK
jgi:hypothetical protein